MEDEARSGIFLEGLLSVRAALLSRSRPVHCVYIQRDRLDGRLVRTESEARSRRVRVRRVDAEFIAGRVTGRTHGGVIAEVGPRRYARLEEILASSEVPFVAMLDGLEDPYNFGQAIRALYAAGADGLVVRPRDWLGTDSIIARASAGASELLPTAVADSPQAAAEVCRGAGLRVVCSAQRPGSVPMHEADLSGPLFLIIGGEKRGISRQMLEHADLLVRVPYGREFRSSLGLTAATSALAFEVLRQRR